jgi:hypothetical protein
MYVNHEEHEEHEGGFASREKAQEGTEKERAGQLKSTDSGSPQRPFLCFFVPLRGQLLPCLLRVLGVLRGSKALSLRLAGADSAERFGAEIILPQNHSALVGVRRFVRA